MSPLDMPIERTMKFYVYTDGASRGNPGKSASGFMILDGSGKKLLGRIFYNGVKTNNFAEYNAVVLALERIKKTYGDGNEVLLFSDSKLVVNQINGVYKTKDASLIGMNKKAVALAKDFDSCSFTNVPRENKRIKTVDKALNIFLDKIKK